MPSGFIYRSGPADSKKKSSTASTGIARGDALKSTSGAVLPLDTNSKCVGVAQEVKASSDAATTAILMILTWAGRTRWQAWEKRASGSVAATAEDTHVEVAGTTGAMGFDSSATTNDDIYLDDIEATGALNVARAKIIFADPAYQHAD